MPPARLCVAVALTAVALVALVALAAVAPGTAAALAAGSAPAAPATWRLPVPGAVVGAFAFSRAAPFAGGARRGIDLVTARGEPVRAACSGRVTHAGPTPHGGGVTVRCGPLVATHLRLAGLRVRHGQRVRRGSRLGVAAGASVRLGARVASDRHGYVDPAALLGDGPGGGTPLVAPPPEARRPRAPRPAAPPAAVAFRGPDPLAPSRLPASRAAAPTLPLLTWVGLALAAAGVPAGTLVRRRRRRRAVPPHPAGPSSVRSPARLRS